MFKTVAQLAFAALLAGTSTQAMAQAAKWTVSEASGQVFVQRGTERVAAKRGTPVAPGDTVTTGTGGRAVLVHNKDFVTVAANSRIRIPAEQASSTMTRFFQDLGNAVFRVEKRGTPHFSVDTPYLAAVVRGTTFSVTVGQADTSLQVTEGVVEVSTSDGGARDLVRPGSVAMIAATDRYRLSITGDQSRVIDSPARGSGGDASGAAPATTVQTVAPTVEVSTSENRAAESAIVAPATVIDVAISSKPADMAEATGGMVSGRSPIVLAALVSTGAALTQNCGRASQTCPPTPVVDVPSRPDPVPVVNEPAGGQTGADKPVVDKPADSGTGAGNADQPANKDAGSGGLGKPTDGSNGSGSVVDKPTDSNNGKGNDDKPGKPDEPKPGKPDDDKPVKGEDNKPEKPDGPKPGKPGDDKPGKGDDNNPTDGNNGKGNDDKPTDGNNGKGNDDKPTDGNNGKGNDDKPAKPDADKPDKSDDDKPGKGNDDKPGKGDDDDDDHHDHGGRGDRDDDD